MCVSPHQPAGGPKTQGEAGYPPVRRGYRGSGNAPPKHLPMAMALRAVHCPYIRRDALLSAALPWFGQCTAQTCADGNGLAVHCPYIRQDARHANLARGLLYIKARVNPPAERHHLQQSNTDQQMAFRNR